MKRKSILFLALLSMFAVNAQWKPQGDKIKTKWAEQVDPNKTLPEYPRPIMERSQWKNLNGLWNYSIQEFGKTAPSKYDGQILVPFAVS